jgi:hypothetical protein
MNFVHKIKSKTQTEPEETFEPDSEDTFLRLCKECLLVEVRPGEKLCVHCAGDDPPPQEPKPKPECPAQKCKYCSNPAMAHDPAGRCMSCMKKMTEGWSERKPAPVSESVSTIQIADLLSAERVEA